MAQKLNLIIDQGTTFVTIFNVNDDAGDALDLSGYSGRAQMRKHYTSSTSTAFTVVVANSGTVSLEMTSNTTTNLTAGRYVYDVELIDGAGAVSRVVEGMLTVTPEVTR